MQIDEVANGIRYSVQSHPFSSKSSMNETPVKWMKIEETRIATKVGNSLSNVPGPLQKCEISSDAHEIPERKIAVITFSRGGASASGGFEIRGQIDVDGDWRGMGNLI